MKPKLYLPFALFIASAIYSPVVNAQIIHTFAGTGTVGYSGNDSLATHAEMNSCSNVAVDGAGNVYIVDRGNNVVRKVNTAGIITTFAGDDTAGYSGDGGLAIAAKLNQPYGIATDVAGNVYITDEGNNVIRRVSTAGVINTYAGTGTPGYTGNGGLADHATLNGPEGIAIDSSDNLYIADRNNNVIREVSSLGVINTIAGNGTPGYSGDNGNALVANLYSPSGVAVDVAGNVYIADQINNVVRKVTYSSGIITTYAGTGIAGATGDGGAANVAQLTRPSSVSLDQAGSVYIADQGNYVIRRVDSLGNISLFAGRYTEGYTGDGGLSMNADLGLPSGVYADGWRRIYIADYNNNVVRIVTQDVLGISAVNTVSTGIKVYPNPTTGMLNVEIRGAVNNASVAVTDILGNTVITAAGTPNTVLNLSDLPAGDYLVKVVNGSVTYTNKIELTR